MGNWVPLRKRERDKIKQGRISLWRQNEGKVPISGNITLSRAALMEFMEACKRGEIQTRKNEKTGELEYMFHLNVFVTDKDKLKENPNLPLFSGYVNPKIKKEN